MRETFNVKYVKAECRATPGNHHKMKLKDGKSCWCRIKLCNDCSSLNCACKCHPFNRRK
jgi:hypothetical protein